MENRQEIIKFPQDLQMKVFMHKLGIVPRHWHRGLELLFVLEGEAQVSVDGQAFALALEDVILINSGSIHELRSKDGALLIVLQLGSELFKFSEDTLDDMEFKCNSSVDPNSERYDGIRKAIARLAANSTSKDPGAGYLKCGICNYLLAELVTYFRSHYKNRSLTRRNYTKRMSEILDYMERHYKEDLSLKDMAKSQNLSSTYFSDFFRRYTGVKFTQYNIDVKLNHALQDLVGTSHTIERIAADNGFPEVHAFIRTFKAKFGMTPNVYRKRNLSQQLSPDKNQDTDNLTVNPSNYANLLLKYLPDDQAIHTMALSAAAGRVEQVQAPIVNVGKIQRRLTHNFKNTIGVGRARDLLNSDIRKMLQDIQNTVGYKYIKFHGILSDDMMVCTRLPDGTLQFRYHMVDLALEFLLSIGLKPMIQLSFMPTALASVLNKTVFYNSFNTSPPKDMSEWSELIADFTRHLIARFGRDEVVSWPFCVWCGPETPTSMFGFGDLPLFCEFYRNTYDTVKSVCPDIRFGSPAFFYTRWNGDPSFLTDFIRYTLLHDCRPDFMNIIYYSDIIPQKTIALDVSNAENSQLPKTSDDFASYITTVRSLFETMGVGSLPVYLTEWNLTISQRNLISDTCFKSCYIMKNLLENYDRLDSFGYWSLTDLIEETSLPSSRDFHGGLGIYTMNGVRKNVFYAFDFANRLGDELLTQGDGYFVTRKGKHIQIITYHYAHYNDVFAAGDSNGVTTVSRYAPFDTSCRVNFSIPLSGIADGRYVVKEYFVNREYGSAFDLWVKMGAMPLSAADSEIYSRTCFPGYHSEYLNSENGCLTYSPTLEPLEIRFAEILPENG